MKLFFLLLFIVVPIIELAILIKVGEIIGVIPTILLVISTAVIGVSLLKRQGIAALDGARQSLEAGKFPVDSVVDAACLLVAGAFLLAPGLLTDTLGFLLLVPSLRRGVAHWLFDRLVASGNVHFQDFNTDGGGPRQDGAPSAGGHTIETEYEDLDRSDAAPDREPRGISDHRDSPWGKNRKPR